jgi:hypothetical protein
MLNTKIKSRKVKNFERLITSIIRFPNIRKITIGLPANQSKI